MCKVPHLIPVPPQVPLEFDFGREARSAQSIRSNLTEYSDRFPLLKKVWKGMELLLNSTEHLNLSE